MRLLLDAHLSGRRIATALGKRGHDLRAADEERGLDGTTDEALLELATSDGRVMVTFNVADFPDLARGWAEQRSSHACLRSLSGSTTPSSGAFSEPSSVR